MLLTELPERAFHSGELRGERVPEPITISALILGAAAGLGVEFGGSQFVDPACARLKAAFRARMAGADGSLPRNHDVERAVRIAQLQACRAIIAEFGDAADRSNRTSDVAFARQSSRWVERRIGLVGRLRIDEADMTYLIAAMDAPLAGGSHPDNDGLIADAIEATYRELALAVPHPPERFRQLFIDGEAGWFVAFGAFLAEQLKTDERFRTVFIGARLAELGGALARIDVLLDSWISVQEPVWTQFRALADEVLVRLQGMEVKLDEALSLLKALATSKDASEAEIAALDREARRLAADGVVKTNAVESFLQDLGETPLQPDEWAAQLATFAERYKALLSEVATRTNLPVDLESKRLQAEASIRAGDLEEAELILAALSDQMAAHRKQIGREEALILARRAELAQARLRYHDAAAMFGRAANLEPADDLEAVRIRRIEQASALLAQCREFGDNAAGREAIDAFRLAIDMTPREHKPLDWAAVQDELGIALLTVGERENEAARLEEAVQAFRAALSERTRERVPLEWADTQNHLGAALSILGRRESGTARLEEAVTAYRAALEVQTRKRAPLKWANTQNNLGTALRWVGRRESGTTRLKEAVDAYRAALKELNRKRSPNEWARIQNNLGVALRTVGERESGTSRLNEAVKAYRAALRELTPERYPLDWATTQNNLGAALWNLGQRESGTSLLEAAVQAYRAALTEYTRERVPLAWATTQNNLGNALSALGRRESGTAKFEEAVKAYRASLEEGTRERVPLEWAMTQNNIAIALSTIGEREGGTAQLLAAIEIHRSALEECTRDRFPYQWAQMMQNLAHTFEALFDRTGLSSHLHAALDAARSALKGFEETPAPYDISTCSALVSDLESRL